MSRNARKHSIFYNPFRGLQVCLFSPQQLIGNNAALQVKFEGCQLRGSQGAHEGTNRISIAVLKTDLSTLARG